MNLEPANTVYVASVKWPAGIGSGPGCKKVQFVRQGPLEVWKEGVVMGSVAGKARPTSS